MHKLFKASLAINYKPKKEHNNKVTFKQSMNIKKGTTGKKLTKHNKKN